jgi:hypothetical protein
MRELREEDWAELVREELDSYSPTRLPQRFQPRRRREPRWPVAAAAVASVLIVGLSILSAAQPRVLTGVFSGVLGRHEQVQPAPATPTSVPSTRRSPGAGGPGAGAAPASVAPTAPEVTANPAAPPPAPAPASQPSAGGGQPLPVPLPTVQLPPLPVPTPTPTSRVCLPVVGCL